MMEWRQLREGVIARHARWIRRQQLQMMLQAAYERFAEEEPHWAASLFDEHFLRTRLLPLLINVDDVRTVDPQLIADAWQAQLYPTHNAPLGTHPKLLCAVKRYLELVAAAYPHSGTPYPQKGGTMFPLQAELIAAEIRRDRERKAKQHALVTMAEAHNGRAHIGARFWSWLWLKIGRRQMQRIDATCCQVEMYG